MSAVPDFAQPLREQDVDPSPFVQFARWFDQATEEGLRAPEAAAVATATAAGAPSVRMVLVKQADESGFVFFSNYGSRKGRELTANPRAALLFYWDQLGRQVRIEGPVQRTSAEETAAYVRSRPRGSRLSALASEQSAAIDSRELLESRVAELAARYEGAELPISDGWGGYRLTPETFEFWQHREDRLHDRLRYTPEGDRGWRLERLAP
jgi:pyridoxamine 5'-phosphate oxidase